MTTPSDASQAVELLPTPIRLPLPNWSWKPKECDLIREYGDKHWLAGYMAARGENALDAAIAQDRAARAQAEPVAWMFKSITGGTVYYEGATRPEGAPERAIPLYDHASAWAQGAGEAVAPHDLPARDPRLTNRAQGVYRKFEVRRTDGSDGPGGKHEGCEYFVIDVTHDQHAKAALTSYADACESTHMVLAADMRDRYSLTAPTIPQAAEVPGQEGNVELLTRVRSAIEQLPKRLEPLGSCTFSYVRCVDVFDLLNQFAACGEPVYAAPTPTASAPAAEPAAERTIMISRLGITDWYWPRLMEELEKLTGFRVLVELGNTNFRDIVREHPALEYADFPKENWTYNTDGSFTKSVAQGAPKAEGEAAKARCDAQDALYAKAGNEWQDIWLANGCANKTPHEWFAIGVEWAATQPQSEADQTSESGDVAPYCPSCDTGSQCKAAGKCLDGTTTSEGAKP